MEMGKAVVMYLAFIGLLIVLGYVIIKINKTTEIYIGESESDKKSVSKRLIVVGLIFIILGIILGNFSYGASSKAGGVFLVFVFLAFIGFLIVLYGMGLYPAPPDSEDLPL